MAVGIAHSERAAGELGPDAILRLPGKVPWGRGIARWGLDDRGLYLRTLWRGVLCITSCAPAGQFPVPAGFSGKKAKWRQPEMGEDARERGGVALRKPEAMALRRVSVNWGSDAILRLPAKVPRGRGIARWGLDDRGLYLRTLWRGVLCITSCAPARQIPRPAALPILCLFPANARGGGALAGGRRTT
jgi:hypothetical protein